MRVITPVAFLGTSAGLGVAWRQQPPTLPTAQNCKDSAESGDGANAFGFPSGAHDKRPASKTIKSSKALTRRSWIQNTWLSTPAIILMSSTAQAALAHDNNPRDLPAHSPTRLSVFAKWTKDQDTSSRGQSNGEEASSGDESSTSNEEDAISKFSVSSKSS